MARPSTSVEDLDQLTARYVSLGNLVARQQEMIDGLLTAHGELMQAHIQLERGQASSRLLQDALHDCLCASNVLTRGEVRRRANERSRIIALLEGIDVSTLNGFASAQDVQTASASSAEHWDNGFLAHLGLQTLDSVAVTPTIDNTELEQFQLLTRETPVPDSGSVVALEIPVPDSINIAIGSVALEEEGQDIAVPQNSIDITVGPVHSGFESVAEEDGTAWAFWRADIAYGLGAALAYADNGAIQRIDAAQCSSVTQAVEMLNSGALTCAAGMCIVYSNRQEKFYLLGRSDQEFECKRIARDIFQVGIKEEALVHCAEEEPGVFLVSCADGVDEQTRCALRCVARWFADNVPNSEENVEANTDGSAAPCSPAAVSPESLARNRTQLHIQTQQRVLDWQLSVGGPSCEADDSDDVEVLKAKLRKVCRINADVKSRQRSLSQSLAAEREKNKKMWEAGVQLQDAYTDQQQQLLEVQSNAEYWQTLATARSSSQQGRQTSKEDKPEEVNQPFVLECWRNASDNLNLCKSITPRSHGSHGGSSGRSGTNTETVVCSASTASTTPLQARQARAVRTATKKGTSQEISHLISNMKAENEGLSLGLSTRLADTRDDSAARKNPNIAQGMVRESVRQLPTPARARNTAESINSWPGEATKKTAGRSQNRRACPTASSTGKGALFGRLPAPPPVAPPAAQPHPQDRRQRGTIAVECSDSDTQSGTEGKPRVADLVPFWESQQQQRRPRTSSDGCVEGASNPVGRERRNTWTGLVGQTALACMERPKVDSDAEQRFDMEVQRRFDMEVDPDQLEVGVDEVINAEVGGDDVGDVMVPHAVPLNQMLSHTSYMLASSGPSSFRKRGRA